MKTFMQKCLDGEVKHPSKEIDDAVDEWHDLSDIEFATVSLHEWLGMNRDEYERWVRNPGSLASILAEKRLR